MRSFVSSIDTGTLNLTTLATLKAALGIDSGDTSEDTSLGLLIARASSEIWAICDLIIPSSDVVETFRFETCERFSERQALLLRYYPIGEISSVTVDGIEVSESDYDLDVRRGHLWRIGGYWSGTIVVTYSGGYESLSDVPATLERAVIELIRERRAASSSVATSSGGIRQVSHGDLSVSYFSEKEQSGSFGGGVPFSVLELIKPYQRLSVA
jgi:hypothetical protein